MSYRPVTSIAQPDSIIYGSCKWEYSTDGLNWTSLGIARGVKFTENIEQSKIQSDNGPDIKNSIGEHTCMVSANALEIYLPKLYVIRGGIDTLSVTSAVATTDTDVYTTGRWSKGDIIWLQNQGATSTLASITKVKSVSSTNGCTTYTATDDYTVVTDSMSAYRRGIVLNAAGAGGDFKDTQALKIKYAYGAIAKRTMKTGGLTSIGALYHRLTNAYIVSGVTKYRYITIYSASLSKGFDMAFKSSNETDPVLELPIEVTGKLDTTRAAGDQLFVIDDQVGVA